MIPLNTFFGALRPFVVVGAQSAGASFVTFGGVLLGVMTVGAVVSVAEKAVARLPSFPKFGNGARKAADILERMATRNDETERLRVVIREILAEERAQRPHEAPKKPDGSDTAVA
jgi:hypothetical protein